MIDLYQSADVVLLHSPEIIGILSSALSKIDPRLMHHGERVAYLAAKICRESADRAEFDLSRLLILCVLHDIGAYKTNEIDDMVRFETETVFDHSLFGYLFLKNTPHLSELAEAILYHHTDYSVTRALDCPCARYADMIHLADRIDILLSSGDRDFSALKGTRFCPAYVDAFLRAEEKYDVSGRVLSGAYQKETADFAASVTIRDSEIMDYLRLLVYAIDFRSPYTVTHTADTTIISMETGRLLHLPEHDMQTLYIGAFLHDIGKIGIPQGILEKPGKLTPEEFEVVKTHIPQGEAILRGVVSDEICDIALRHHEKLDGSGYSRGLTAEALTLPQRIVAVADILSALSQRRSYKEPFPKDRVVAILTDMKRAGQLCPLVVDTVCEHYDLILDNTQRSHDPVKMLYHDLIAAYHERGAALRAQNDLTR